MVLYEVYRHCENHVRHTLTQSHMKTLIYGTETIVPGDQLYRSKSNVNRQSYKRVLKGFERCKLRMVRLILACRKRIIFSVTPHGVNLLSWPFRERNIGART